MKGEAAKLGRDSDHISVCNMLTPVTGATKMEAEDRMALISKLPLEIDALSLLAEGVNFDFASKGMDEPLVRLDLMQPFDPADAARQQRRAPVTAVSPPLADAGAERDEGGTKRVGQQQRRFET